MTKLGKTHTIHSIFFALCKILLQHMHNNNFLLHAAGISPTRRHCILQRFFHRHDHRHHRMRLAAPSSSAKALSHRHNHEHLECDLHLGKFPPHSPNRLRHLSHDDIHYILFSGTSYFTWLRAGNVFKWTSDHNCHAELAQRCKIIKEPPLTSHS